MWGLTRQEQRIILFLLTTFAIGCAVLWWRQQRPAPPVDANVLSEFAQLNAPAVAESAKVIAASPATPRAEKIPAAPVDLNAATLQELARLPGIGPVMAQRIVDYRSAHGRFAQATDLLKVKGIGKKTFEKLQPLIAAK